MDRLVENYPILKNNAEKFKRYINFVHVYSFIQQLSHFYFYLKNTNAFDTFDFNNLQNYDYVYTPIVLVNYEAGDFALINDFFYEFNGNTELIQANNFYLGGKMETLLKELAAIHFKDIKFKKEYTVKEFIFLEILLKLIEFKLDPLKRQQITTLEKDPKIYKESFRENFLSEITVGNKYIDELLVNQLDQHVHEIEKFSFFQDLKKRGIVIYNKSIDFPKAVEFHLLSDHFIICFHPREDIIALISLVKNLQCPKKIAKVFLESEMTNEEYKEIYFETKLFDELLKKQKINLQAFISANNLGQDEIHSLNAMIRAYLHEGIVYLSKRTGDVSIMNSGRIRGILKLQYKRLNAEISKILEKTITLKE